MTFEHTETATTSATPDAVWALWSDPGSWASWDPSVESVAFEGHFAEGAAGTMVLAGGIEVPVVVELVEPGARFLDRLDLGDLHIRIDHVVTAVDAGAEVSVNTVIEGPGADEVGAMVTADAPQALAALTALAESTS
ncbi:hypothetical protein G5V58_01520 [Nocardioides anomalus]|uniref:Polyketide cyclase n=1 Tax=Nocardioides anomalus TaxID=2712223 RepID=A0A6G6W8Z8_9ACTN|nr:SRPBCC family protein [Nocardioides anomalus]QIG41627.1 hypothetical protein G5V58_01520 [Nocardioides anomalus]